MNNAKNVGQNLLKVRDLINLIGLVDREIVRLEDAGKDINYFKTLRTKLEQYGDIR